MYVNMSKHALISFTKALLYKTHSHIQNLEKIIAGLNIGGSFQVCDIMYGQASVLH